MTDNDIEPFIKYLEDEQMKRQNAAEDMGLVFEDNQGKKHYLSASLVERQQVNPKQIEQLKALHIQLADILEKAKDMPAFNLTYDEVRERVQEIEFALQEAWNFKPDANYHSHWKRIPGCSCPKMDNDDPVYFGRGKIINQVCPVHGKTLS